MPTVEQLLAALVRSALELPAVFLTEVVLREPVDPLAVVSIAVGTLLTVLPVAALGYLVLGAALAEVGVSLPVPGRSPPRPGR